MANVNLDKKDKELLSLLYQDSRASFVQLGKKLKLSSSAVERRLRQLKGAGVVALLFADVNLMKLGLKSYRIYVKFDAMDEATEKAVLELFESYPRTLWGVICEGEYDLLWRIVAKDELEVEQAISVLTRRFGAKIVEKTVVLTTSQLYLAWNNALDTERHPEFPPERIVEAEEADAKDVKMLKTLYGNARATSVELAAEVDLTPDAVQHRLKRLREKEFILGSTIWLDAKKLGFNYYKLLVGFRGSTPEVEKELLSYCCERNEVVFINKTIGSWDLEVDVIVRNNEELHAFTRELKTRFGQIIGKHTFISAIEERMLNPLRGGINRLEWKEKKD
jgi:Lrp/AsnC family leucine-responsive transcriptional regulator